MKLTTYLSLLIISSLLIFACKGKKNPYDEYLSKESQEALSKFAKDQCVCIKENESELKELTDLLKPIIEQVEKGEEVKPEEIMGKMMEVMGKMQGYGECVEGKQPDEAAMKKVEEELKAAFSDLEESERQRKQVDALLSYMKEECPDGTEFFETFVKFGEAMQNISKP